MKDMTDSFDITTACWMSCALGFVIAVSILDVPSVLWLVIVMIMAISWVRRVRDRRIWLVGLLGFCLGTIRMQLDQDPPINQSQMTVQESWVVSATRQGDRAKVVLWHPNVDGYSVKYQPQCLHLPHIGFKIAASSTISPLESAPNPGAFDALSHGLSESIRWRYLGSIDCQKKITGTDRSTAIRRDVRRLIMDGDNLYGRRLLTGILTGDRFHLTDDALRAFGESGTGHLLAVSGLHVGGCALSSFWLFNILALRLGVRFPHRVGAIASIVSIGFMLVISNAPLSAQRASIMLIAYLFGRALGVRPPILRCLSWAAIGMMWNEPSVLTSAGFQFSFIAVLGLSVYGGRKRGPVNWLQVAFIAWVFTAPIQMWHFGTIAPTSVIANLILTPITAVFLVPLGLFSILCSPLTQTPMEITAHAAQMLVCIAEALVDMFGGHRTLGRWTTPVLCMMPLGIHLCRRPVVSLLALCALATTALCMKPPSDYVDFVSVGQGDAILLVSDGEAALIDVGPDLEARRLISHLRQMGISRIEWVAITHQHPDHFNGLDGLIGQIDIGVVYHGPVHEQSLSWKRLKNRLASKGVITRTLNSEHRSFGQLHVRTYGPTISPHVSENDRSLAFRVDGPMGSILLTGDLEHFGEHRLVALKPGVVDVLKLGHHGSKTSTSSMILKETRPSFSIASCGRFNRYKFPHDEVVDRVHKSGSTLLSTADNGLVRIRLKDEFKIQVMRTSNRYGARDAGGLVNGVSWPGGSLKKVLSVFGGS